MPSIMKRRNGETGKRMMHCTAALQGGLIVFLLFCFLLITYHFSLVTASYAELIDRVVAFVDDRAITLREFEELYEKNRKVKPDISRAEVLNTYINRIVLLKEARKLKVEAKTDDELINEYIELKVRSLIRIKEDAVKEFYNSHLSEFKGAVYEEVREKIEEYLTEQEINNQLKMHIEELRARAYIKIVMKEL